MKMKEVMDLYHVSRKALLIYENKGLISPQRNSSDYREYGDHDIDIIKKIILLRKLEFSLEEIEVIVMQNHIELIQEKKEMYEKQKHLIDTKKSYLDYVVDVFNNESDIDEAIDAVQETMELYKTDQYKPIIQFEFHRDCIGIVWCGSLLISLLSGKEYLIVGSLLLGILSIIFCLSTVRSKLIALPYKPLLSILLLPGGIVGLIYLLPLEDTISHCMMSMFCVIAIIYSLSLFDNLKEFLCKYRNGLSLVSALIGIIIFMITLFVNLEGILGYLSTSISCWLMVWGFKYNQMIMDIVKRIFSQ